MVNHRLKCDFVPKELTFGVIEVDEFGRNKLLQCPAPSEITTLSEGRFPRSIRRRALSSVFCRYIGEIDVAPRCLLIPSKHRVDGRCKLYRIPLIDTACIYPAVTKPVHIGLFRAEGYFLPANFVPAGTSFGLLERDLIVSPCMGKYGIGWDIVAGSLRIMVPSGRLSRRRIVGHGLPADLGRNRDTEN